MTQQHFFIQDIDSRNCILCGMLESDSFHLREALKNTSSYQASIYNKIYPEFSIESANSGTPTFMLFWRAMLKSGMNWRMHPAQLNGMQYMSARTQTRTEEMKQDLDDVIPGITFLGVPVQLDKDMHKGWIELRLKDQIIHRIENLAVPMGWDNF